MHRGRDFSLPHYNPTYSDEGKRFESAAAPQLCDDICDEESVVKSGNLPEELPFEGEGHIS
jgi:hypothetical protein